MKNDIKTKIFSKLSSEFAWKNEMQLPRIQKIVVNTGTGKRARVDKERNKLVADRLVQITGQKPASRAARLSIAGFKIRQGDPIGQMVTLRGASAESFFEKLVHIALPRTKDFRGISESSVDAMGNMTLGITEHTIFPETSDENLSDVFSLSITIVTSTRSRDEALRFFTELGVPFVTKTK